MGEGERNPPKSVTNGTTILISDGVVSEVQSRKGGEIRKAGSKSGAACIIKLVWTM